MVVILRNSVTAMEALEHIRARALSRAFVHGDARAAAGVGARRGARRFVSHPSSTFHCRIQPTSLHPSDRAAARQTLHWSSLFSCALNEETAGTQAEGVERVGFNHESPSTSPRRARSAARERSPVAFVPSPTDSPRWCRALLLWRLTHRRSHPSTRLVVWIASAPPRDLSTRAPLVPPRSAPSRASPRFSTRPRSPPRAPPPRVRVSPSPS